MTAAKRTKGSGYVMPHRLRAKFETLRKKLNAVDELRAIDECVLDANFFGRDQPATLGLLLTVMTGATRPVSEDLRGWVFFWDNGKKDRQTVRASLGRLRTAGLVQLVVRRYAITRKGERRLRELRGPSRPEDDRADIKPTKATPLDEEVARGDDMIPLRGLDPCHESRPCDFLGARIAAVMRGERADPIMVIVEPSERVWWAASIPSMPGRYAQGRTIPSALVHLADVVRGLDALERPSARLVKHRRVK